MFFIPFNLIRIQGYSAALAGAAFLPFSLIMGAAVALVRRADRALRCTAPAHRRAADHGHRASRCSQCPGIGGSYWTMLFPPMVVLGFGMAISVAPLTTTVMRGAEDRYAGVASGINNATARVAGMLAVALLGAIAVGAFAGAVDERLDRLQVTPEVRLAVLAEVPKLAEAAVPKNVDPAEGQILQRALRESFVQSFRFVSLLTAVLAALSAAVAWLTIDRK